MSKITVQIARRQSRLIPNRSIFRNLVKKYIFRCYEIKLKKILSKKLVLHFHFLTSWGQKQLHIFWRYFISKFAWSPIFTEDQFVEFEFKEIHLYLWNVSYLIFEYNQTCVQPPPSGPWICGRCWQVVVVLR